MERTALLERFGLFGIRLGSTLLRQKVVATATDLATTLVERSGLEDLQDVLRSLFFTRRDLLKSRSALLAVDTLLRTGPRPGSAPLATAVEEILASAHPFNELRVLASLRAGWVTGKPDILDDLEHVIGGDGTAPHLRLQLPTDAQPPALRDAAAQALARWQRRAENPMTSHQLAVASRVAIRSCEGMLAELGSGR
jgi:hypothetical protein